MDDRVVSYAQNREDMILAAFFDENKKGFYVDIGASHPVVSSVTKHFYEKGWRGINIEPNRKHYELLVADRPEDINLNVGVSDAEAELEFREYEGYGLSTFSTEMKQSYEKHGNALTDKFTDYKVPVTTLKKILDDNEVKKINFLKIDIEGFEYEALSGNDWKKYRPEVICIESNHITNDWRPLLNKEKYTKVFFDGLNDYYVAEEAQQAIKEFSYPDKILLSKPIISLQWHQELGAAASRYKKLELELQSEKSKLWDAQRTIVFLQTELQDQRRIRNLVKTLLRKLDASIKGRIENLNKPVRKHASKLIPVNPALIDAAGSRHELLGLARENDLKNFYSTAKTGSYSKLYFYKTCLWTYTTARGSLKFVFRLAKRVLRKLKRIVKR